MSFTPLRQIDRVHARRFFLNACEFVGPVVAHRLDLDQRRVELHLELPERIARASPAFPEVGCGGWKDGWPMLTQEHSLSLHPLFTQYMIQRSRLPVRAMLVCALRRFRVSR